MEETIFKYISGTFGISFAFALSVILLALWLTHYVTKKVTEIKKDHSIFENNSRQLTEDIGEIRRDISFLKGSFDILRTHGGLMESHSPITLTDEGRRVAIDLEADTIINQNWDKIHNDIVRRKLNSAYDIQQYCIETASVEPERFFNDEAISKIKEYAYNHGKTDQLYLRVVGLLIRDRYLKEILTQ